MIKRYHSFGKFLLYLELLWIILFISLCIYSFVVTTRFPFGGPMGENMRSDTFALRTHILVFGTILGILETRKPVWWWAMPILVLMLFSDVCNLVELCCFSPVRDAMHLWPFSIVVSAYQTTVTVLAMCWLIVLLEKNGRIVIKVPH